VATWIVIASLLLVCGLIAVPEARAQTSSIEELEQRIQKAKDEKARRDAAAAKSNADAARAASERKAQDARLANLVVQSDASCTLSVNGKEVAQLAKGITEVKVTPGQKLVSCVSKEGNVSFDGQVEARSGQDTVLRVSLAERVEAAQRSKREADERTQRERREADERAQRERREAEARTRTEAESRAATDAAARRFQAVSEDVLFDAQAGLQWTRADNGSDVDWSQAQAHCRGLGSGWSLPTVAQLQSLYDKSLPGFLCGGNLCRVPNLFRLSKDRFWSSEVNGSSEAWYVFLDHGTRYSFRVGASYNGRAMCVRRP
jgi:hypothetical protein